MMGREPEQITDEWLVLCAKAGSRAAMEALVRRWQPKLLAHARHVTGQADAASDVVQEAWLAIVRTLDRLRDPAAFRGWAYRIVHSCAVDWIRRRKRQRDAIRDLSQSKSTEENESLTESAANRSRLAAAIDALEPEQKLLLRMYYVDRMRVQEISASLGAPNGTIKYRLFQLRQSLKSFIEGESRGT